MRLLLLAAGLLLMPIGHSAEPAKPAKPPADPWVGHYFKYGRSNVEKERFSIRKRADGGYQLSKQYESYKFVESEKGILYDGKGGIGKLILGEAKFADGTKTRVIRAEFCYEQFLLADVWGDAASIAGENR